MSQNDIANILWFAMEKRKEKQHARKALHSRTDRRADGREIRQNGAADDRQRLLWGHAPGRKTALSPRVWARGLHQSQDRPGGTLSETLYKHQAPEKDTGAAAVESVKNL